MLVFQENRSVIFFLCMVQLGVNHVYVLSFNIYISRIEHY